MVGMEKLPFVPQAPTLSAEEVRHAIAGLRRFHLGDPQARALLNSTKVT